MWERFGYYAARALLALYVTKVLRDPTFDVERVLGLRTVGKTFSNYDFAMAVNASDAVGMMETIAKYTEIKSKELHKSIKPKTLNKINKKYSKELTL